MKTSVMILASLLTLAAIACGGGAPAVADPTSAGAMTGDAGAAPATATPATPAMPSTPAAPAVPAHK